MDLSALRIFVDVMEQGSFAAVARRSDFDPSAVSRTIAALERDLGVRLFQRTTRTLAPTEAGQLYYEKIGPLIDDIERAGTEVRDTTTAPTGKLRVTASVAFGTTCLVPLLPHLRASYPSLEIELILTDGVLDLIEERIDVAIRLGQPAPSDLISTRLMKTHYRVCASPAYIARNGRPETPEDLSNMDALAFDLSGFRTAWRFRGPSGPEREVPIRAPVVISNALALQRAALEGVGPALLATWLIGDDLKAGRLIDLFPDEAVTATHFDTAAYILFPSRAYVPLKVRVFIDFLKGNLDSMEPRR